MPTDAREQVMAALKTRLDTIVGIAGLVVERSRTETLKADELPRLLLYDAGVTVQNDFTGEREFTLTAEIHGCARGATAELAATAASELRAKCDDVVLDDVGLGGLVRDTRPLDDEPPEPLELDADIPALGWVRRYAIDYATPEADPFTLI